MATSPPVVSLFSLKTAPNPGIVAVSPSPGCTTVSTAPLVVVIAPPSPIGANDARPQSDAIGVTSERLEQLVELFVALGHTALRARGQQAVAGLDRRAYRPAPQSAATVAEVFKPHEVQVDHIRCALEFECLDDE